MTATSPLTEQQRKDLAPIFDRFPNTMIDDECSPIIMTTLTDAEEDEVLVMLDMEGNAQFDTDDYAHLILSAGNLATISREADLARQLWKNWMATPSGKAWLADI